MIKKISTDKAPKAIGPYSQAILCGGMLYTSGQIALSPESGELVGDNIAEQTEQIMKNLSAVLAEAGTSFQNVVKTTCFLADIADFAAMNEVYASFFSEPFPARSAFAVRDLPKGALVEIEMIAAK